LFSWNSLSDTEMGQTLTSGMQVSILVFVELALGPYLGCSLRRE